MIDVQETAVPRTRAASAALTADSRRLARLEVTEAHGTPAGDELSGAPVKPA